MSYGRVQHPSEMVRIGQELEVKVLDIDWERERISLGLKQLQPYPWKNVAAKYPVGTRVQGKVVSITNYGAFVELEPGIEGLVHISEMSWTRNVRHPSKIVSIGETIEAVVLKVDETEEKVSLGMKQTEEDPWMGLPQKYPVGMRIKGKVRNLTSFGAFVEIEPGIDGLIHISDMSWTKRVQHPSEVVKKGDEVEVLVLNVDAENKRISLGLKQAQEDPWLRIGETYPVGTELRGRVLRLMDKGVVVDIGNDIEGFVPMSQLGIPDIHNPGEAVKEAQAVELKVLEVDPIHHRVGLAGPKVLADGVVTGWGLVDGRLVYVFAQDFTVFGGSRSEAHAEKICKVMDLAVRNGAPIIGLSDSGGARIQEGVSSLGGYAEIFLRNTLASGVVPQISAVLGPCAGGAVYSPAITDFVFMVRNISYMFVTGPNVVKTVTHEEADFEKLGGADVHGGTSGIAHFVHDSELESIGAIRTLLSFLPGNNLDSPPTRTPDDPPDRREEALLEVVPDEPTKPYDMHDVLRHVVDNGAFLEVQRDYARDLIVGFARLAGRPVGVIANQPAALRSEERRVGKEGRSSGAG